MIKKIMLMALVMITLIAAGCGSEKNEQATKQQSLTPEEQLAIYKDWDTEVMGEIDKVMSSYDAMYRPSMKEIADNPNSFEKPINNITVLDKILVDSMDKLAKTKAPSKLDKEQQEKLNKIVDDIRSWVESRHQICQLTLDMFNKEKQVDSIYQQLDIVKETMPKIKQISEQGEPILVNAISEIKKVRASMKANAGKSDSDIIFVKESDPVDNTQNAGGQTNPSIPVVQKVFSEIGINGTVIATSYGHSNKGFLTQFQNGSAILIDKINNQMVGVKPQNVIKNISDYRGNDKQSIQFDILILSDTRGADANSGIWDGGNHLLPILVEYTYENGKHIPGMIKTGSGASPASYDNYLYEQKNVDAVNMIIEEAAAVK